MDELQQELDRLLSELAELDRCSFDFSKFSLRTILNTRKYTY